MNPFLQDRFLPQSNKVTDRLYPLTRPLSFSPTTVFQSIAKYFWVSWVPFHLSAPFPRFFPPPSSPAPHKILSLLLDFSKDAWFSFKELLLNVLTIQVSSFFFLTHPLHIRDRRCPLRSGDGGTSVPCCSLEAFLNTLFHLYFTTTLQFSLFLLRMRVIQFRIFPVRPSSFPS